MSPPALGASLTFSKIVQAPAPPIYGPFSTDTTQTYMGVSWLLFLLDLAFTSFAACALTLWRPQAISYFGTEDSQKRRIVMWYASAVSAVLFGMLIVAFLFLGLVVVSFAGGIGWAAVGFTVLVGCLGMGSIVWQSPIGSKAIGGEGPSRQGTGLDQYGGGGAGGGLQRVGSYKPQVRYEETPVYHDGGEYGGRGGYEDGGRIPKSYGEVRQSSISRPMVAEVPGYLADMRRTRAIRISGDSSYGEKY
ncbi:hypothetical protein LSUE1_G000894 [Lachnellula suecica]|uniref:Uncharacterized protein n=1 Tax=Lachnellula suecica TaxID=602035 RepID=A0A8T9CKP0_9HELO|nr:hypothetical protein LSUE1_G000894 [Lachnellula suecica]